MKNTFHPTMVMTAALLVFALLVVPLALAVTFTVNSTDDLPDDLTKPGNCHTAANTCTLRAGVMQANRTSGAGATIMGPAGIYTLIIPAAGADGEENGDLNLTTVNPAPGPVITIIGAGADQTIIDGNQLDRVFYIGPGREASIAGVTIQNGFFNGITNQWGALTIQQILIGLQTAEASTTWVKSTFTIRRSPKTMPTMTVIPMAAGGGGVYNSDTGIFNLRNSLIA